MTPSDEPVNLAESDWPDDETLDPRSAATPPVGGMPVGEVPAPVPTARPGVSPTLRWVAVAAAVVGVALLSRLPRWLRHHPRIRICPR